MWLHREPCHSLLPIASVLLCHCHPYLHAPFGGIKAALAGAIDESFLHPSVSYSYLHPFLLSRLKTSIMDKIHSQILGHLFFSPAFSFVGYDFLTAMFPVPFAGCHAAAVPGYLLEVNALIFMTQRKYSAGAWTAELQAFILSSSPLPDPHVRQSLLSSRTNRCFSCYTVCCLIPRQGTVWCIPMQLSALEGTFPWIWKEMQLIITSGFTAALTSPSSGSESQM